METKETFCVLDESRTEMMGERFRVNSIYGKDGVFLLPSYMDAEDRVRSHLVFSQTLENELCFGSIATVEVIDVVRLSGTRRRADRETPHPKSPFRMGKASGLRKFMEAVLNLALFILRVQVVELCKRFFVNKDV